MYRTLSNGKQRGSALIVALISMVILAGLALSYVDAVTADSIATDRTLDEARADALAAAGVSVVTNQIRTGAISSSGSTQVLFDSAQVDVIYTVDAADPSKYVVTGTARQANTVRALQAKVQGQPGGGPFWYAIFAGNSGNDPTYNMPFGGTGASGDEIIGAAYSGANMLINGNAMVRTAIPSDPNYVPGQNGAINGDVKTTGTLTNNNPLGIEGTVTHGSEPLPDLAQYEFEQKAIAAFNGDPLYANQFVNVSSELAANGTSGSWSKGGTALQIADANNPAHIFRMNPSDRGSLNSGTVGNDYYLEDPTANTPSEQQGGSAADVNYNGNNAYHVKLSANGTGKVYFVDGNLWINNVNTYSFVMKHNEANGIKMTFVVKGNIYIGDNLYYNNQNNDGIALIALRDSALEAANPGLSTGNINLGDPLFGTTRKMEAFMYAENNFIDNNITSAGSDLFTIRGNMTAGNQVAINREWGNGVHSKMEVYFDPRIRDDVNFRNAMPYVPVPGPSAPPVFNWYYTAVVPPTSN